MNTIFTKLLAAGIQQDEHLDIKYGTITVVHTLRNGDGQKFNPYCATRRYNEAYYLLLFDTDDTYAFGSTFGQQWECLPYTLVSQQHSTYTKTLPYEVESSVRSATLLHHVDNETHDMYYIVCPEQTEDGGNYDILLCKSFTQYVEGAYTEAFKTVRRIYRPKMSWANFGRWIAYLTDGIVLLADYFSKDPKEQNLMIRIMAYGSDYDSSKGDDCITTLLTGPSGLIDLPHLPNILGMYVQQSRYSDEYVQVVLLAGNDLSTENDTTAYVVNVSRDGSSMWLDGTYTLPYKPLGRILSIYRLEDSNAYQIYFMRKFDDRTELCYTYASIIKNNNNEQ